MNDSTHGDGYDQSLFTFPVTSLSCQLPGCKDSLGEERWSEESEIGISTTSVLKPSDMHPPDKHKKSRKKKKGKKSCDEDGASEKEKASCKSVR